MTKFLTLIAAAIMFLNNSAYADESGPFVDYQLSEEVELYENAWRVQIIVPTFDMRQVNEPTVACKAYLELLDPADPLLNVNFQVIPDGEFEVYYLRKWMLASRFEHLMKTTSCLTNGTKG